MLTEHFAAQSTLSVGAGSVLVKCLLPGIGAHACSALHLRRALGQGRLSAAQHLDGADPASPDLGFRAILGLGWPGGSSRFRWAATDGDRDRMTRNAYLLAAALVLAACSGSGTVPTALPQSPDTQRMSAPQEGLSLPPGHSWGIYRLALQTEALDLLYSSPTRVSYLRLDPAGNRLVFSGTVDGDANEQEEIFSMDANGRDLRRLTDNAHWDLYPVWAPDATKIAFLSWRTDSLGIFTMGPNGDNPQELLDSPSHEADIDWANGVIVFTRESRVWAMRPDGSDAKPLTDPPRAGEWGAANLPFGDYDPRVSPDGSKVVFERLLADASPHGNYDLFVVDLATHEESRLTATGFSQGLPSWSHSGTQLVYVVSAIDGVGQYDLYIMNSDGTDSHNITPTYFPPQFLCHWAVFSADDSYLYFIGQWWS